MAKTRIPGQLRECVRLNQPTGATEKMTSHWNVQILVELLQNRKQVIFHPTHVILLYEKFPLESSIPLAGNKTPTLVVGVVRMAASNVYDNSLDCHQIKHALFGLLRLKFIDRLGPTFDEILYSGFRIKIISSVFRIVWRCVRIS